MLDIRFKSIATTAAASLLLIVGPVTHALAEPKPPTPGGGGWNYGVQDPQNTGGRSGHPGHGTGGNGNGGGSVNPAASCGPASTTCGTNCVWVCNNPPGAAVAAITPQMLLQRALGQLRPPTPEILTAPPRGSKGVVGLPEWFWLNPLSAGPITKRLAIGPIWIELTASAQALTISPGRSLAAFTCPGTGTAYVAGAPYASSCSYTYQVSSALQPSAVYSVSATVDWGGTWVGSGNTGGTLPTIPVTSTFTVPVAEAQALNGGGR
jgi:hypothetical protein